MSLKIAPLPHTPHYNVEDENINIIVEVQDGPDDDLLSWEDRHDPVNHNPNIQSIEGDDSIWGFLRGSNSDTVPTMVNVHKTSKKIENATLATSSAATSADINISDTNIRTIPTFDLIEDSSVASEVSYLGVSVEFLLLIRKCCATLYGQKDVDQLTTRDVANRFFTTTSISAFDNRSTRTSQVAIEPPPINPVSSSSPISFLEDFQTRYSSNIPHPVLGVTCKASLISPATVYISHCWSYTFNSLVDALQEYCRIHREQSNTTPFFWLDIFYNRPTHTHHPQHLRNQPNNRQPSMPPLQQMMLLQLSARVIRRIGRTCVVLLPWRDPLALRHSRCLCELLLSLTSSSSSPSSSSPIVEVQLSSGRHQSFLDLLAESVPAAVAAVDLSVKVEASDLCGDPDDEEDGFRELLLRQMRQFPDGWPAVNEIITNALQRWRSDQALRAATSRLAQSEQEAASYMADQQQQYRPAERAQSAADGQQGSSCQWLQAMMLGSVRALWRSVFLSNTALTSASAKQQRQVAEEGKLRANLAALLHELGRFDEAEMHYKALLRSQLQRERGGGGENHPLALSAAGNLALLLRKQGRLEEAETLYRRVLTRKQKVLGASHPSTLTTHFNLAAVLRAQGTVRNVEAEQVLRVLLPLQQAALGKDHSDCLLTMETLAALLLDPAAGEQQLNSSQNSPLHRERSSFDDEVNSQQRQQQQQRLREAEAMTLLQELLMLKIDHFGPHHPASLQAGELVAALYLQQGLAEFAADLYEEALTGREAVYGPNHSSSWAARLRLAAVLKLLGRSARAKDLFARLSEHYPSVLGEHHSTSIAVREAYGELCLQCGQSELAESVLRALVDCCERGGISTLAAEFLLAEAMGLQGRNNEAESLHRKVLTQRRAELGWTHVDSFRSMHALANSLIHQRRWLEARPLLEEALEGLDTHCGGPQNPHSIAAAECLWRLCRRCGDHQQADMLLLRLGGHHPPTSSPLSQAHHPPEQPQRLSRHYQQQQQQQWSRSEQDDDDDDSYS